jgi:hypothetical protein
MATPIGRQASSPQVLGRKAGKSSVIELYSLPILICRTSCRLGPGHSYFTLGKIQEVLSIIHNRRSLYKARH